MPHKGYKCRQEDIEKRRKSNIGKIHSEESRKRISEGRKGIPMPEWQKLSLCWNCNARKSAKIIAYEANGQLKMVEVINGK